MLKTLQTSAERRSEMIYPQYDIGHYNAAAQLDYSLWEIPDTQLNGHPEILAGESEYFLKISDTCLPSTRALMQIVSF